MVNRKKKEINYLTCSIKVVETQWPCFTFDHLDLKLDQLTISLTFTNKYQKSVPYTEN